MRGKLKAPKRVSIEQQDEDSRIEPMLIPLTSSPRALPQIGLELSPDEMWSRLSNAISQIQNHNVSTLSYEEHYRYAYNMILVSSAQLRRP